jgi:death-on-curing protein
MKKAIQYLTAEQVLALNQQAVDQIGGGTAGVQSPRAFDVVVNQPRQVLFGHEVYGTIWLKAAYMMQQIIKTPVFVDGSKRTAMLVGQTFLTQNGSQPRDDDFNSLAKVFILEMTQRPNDDANMALVADWLADQFVAVGELN